MKRAIYISLGLILGLVLVFGSAFAATSNAVLYASSGTISYAGSASIADAVSAPDDGKFIQLGPDGWVTLRFPLTFAAVPDGTSAPDLQINTYDVPYPANAAIYVSLNGTTWTKVGVFPDTANIDLDLIGPVKFVKVDQTGEYIDPAYPTLGFDLDAVVALNAGTLPYGEITNPELGEVVSGIVHFEAIYWDDDPSTVLWAVRKGTCAAATNTVIGNVDGKNTPYTWDKHLFAATADTSTWEDGSYCFVFNPIESAGEVEVRLTQFNVVNQPPVADAGGPYSGFEGQLISFNGSASADPSGEILTYAWDFGDGSSGSGESASNTYGDNGTYNVSLTVTDPANKSDTAITAANIANVAPTVGVITGPLGPVAVGTPVTASALFTDPGTLDSHTALFDWGDGTSTDGTVVSGSALGSHSYATSGVYKITLTVTDDDGGEGVSSFEYVVVYDPSGGFVTGGGWIDSPAGAMAPVPAMAWNQGFEVNTDGWQDSTNGWYGSVSQVPSGNNGVTSSSGSYHAIMEGDADSAPFTRFDGYRSTWPGTWTAEIDIYLDPAWDSGTGFDYSVAATGSDGDHLRDYIFHVTKDTSTGILLVAGSNNTNYAPREDLENINHYEVTTAGWYTFQHIFYDQAGALAVDLNLLGSNGNVLFTETRYNAADLIPLEVGGNRYGWFTFINVGGGIAVDEHQLYIPVNITGKATFGFVSKYQKGAAVPTGNTEFQFKAGGLNFKSTSYEWLVVAGSKAQFKGEGMINGEAGYGFMLTAVDGTPDKFRIKIWKLVDESIVYDNQMGADQTAELSTALGGGSIVIHK